MPKKAILVSDVLPDVRVFCQGKEVIGDCGVDTFIVRPVEDSPLCKMPGKEIIGKLKEAFPQSVFHFVATPVARPVAVADGGKK